MTEPARRRGPKPTLDADIIVQTALRVLADTGISGFSMRRLGQDLGVSPMALYTYFRNRDALLHRVADDFIGSVPWPPPEFGTWKDRIHEHQTQVARALARFPGLVRFGAPTDGASALGPNLSRNQREHLALLLDAGFSPTDAAAAYGAIVMLIRGYLEVDGGPAPTPDAEGHASEIGPVEDSLALLHELDTFQRFLVALELLLDALSTRLTAHTGPGDGTRSTRPSASGLPGPQRDHRERPGGPGARTGER